MPNKKTSANALMLGVSPDGMGGAVVGIGTARIWLKDRVAMEDLFAVMNGTPAQGGFERDREGIRYGPVTAVMAPFQAERIKSRLDQLLSRPTDKVTESDVTGSCVCSED